jgi:hypothetical protein
MGFRKALSKVPPESLSFHEKRGDFEAWAEGSLKDDALAKDLAGLRRRKLKGEALREELVRIAAKRLDARKAYLKALGLSLQ